MTLEKTYTPNIQQSEIFAISKFVVAENFKHHANHVLPTDYRRDVDSIYKEEIGFIKNSKIFTIKTGDGNIIGTIRVLKWDYISPLPIQKMFGVDPLLWANGNSINEIWHIGRFAIKRGARNVNLLKKLMVCAISPVCNHKDNIAFAECDAKLLRILSLMGIKVKIVGESIDYLGSETIPVCMTYDGLIDFYNKNKYLIAPESLNQAPESRSMDIGSLENLDCLHPQI